MRRTALTIAAAGAAALGLGLAPAAALAAPVLYVYYWDAETLVEYTDPVAGTGEVVPTTRGVEAVTGLDVASDGTGYAVDHVSESHLYSVNVLTGAVADLGMLTYAGESIRYCTGLDYTSGVLTIACDGIEGGGGGYHYLTVNPTTLTTELIVSSDVRAASIAVDPADGQLYGFGYGREIMTVSDGAAVQVGTSTQLLWGADFANDGSLWATVEDTALPTTVGDWVFHPAALTPDGTDDFVENLTVYEAAAPVEPAAPQLAATGSDPAPVLFGALAVIALGAGVATAVTVRRRTV